LRRAGRSFNSLILLTISSSPNREGGTSAIYAYLA
jgi:hypothetical protein